MHVQQVQESKGLRENLTTEIDLCHQFTAAVFATNGDPGSQDFKILKRCMLQILDLNLTLDTLAAEGLSWSCFNCSQQHSVPSCVVLRVQLPGVKGTPQIKNRLSQKLGHWDAAQQGQGHHTKVPCKTT